MPPMPMADASESVKTAQVVTRISTTIATEKRISSFVEKYHERDAPLKQDMVDLIGWISDVQK